MPTIQRILTTNKNGVFTHTSKLGERAINGTLRPFNAKYKPKNDFFRENELYQNFKDKNYTFPAYDYNDLPLSDNLRPVLRKLHNRLNNQYTDNTPLESAKLIGTNRKVYLESVYDNPTTPNQLLIDYVDQGYKFQDAANIFYRANGHYNREFLDEAFSLIDDQYPIELVLKYMDKCIYNNGIYRHNGLMRFLAYNPDKIDKVLKNHNGYEYFDKALADNYHVIESLCKNEDDVDKVIQSCECRGLYGESITNPELLDFALTILSKQKTWYLANTNLFENIKKISRPNARNINLQFDPNKLYIAQKMYKQQKSIQNIISVINYN